jgi:hypothetical protein
MYLSTILLLNTEEIRTQSTQQKLDENDVKFKHCPPKSDDCCRRMEFKFSSELNF